MAISELPSGTWALSSINSSVSATAKMMNAVPVPATFQVVSGSISIVDGELDIVEATVDASSYKSSIAKRNKDVTSSAFLDAAKFPTMTFTASGGSDRRVTGQLTVKGQTVEVAFAISELRVSGTDATFVATATVDRFAFGVSKSPAFVIGKDIDITVHASASTAG